MLEQINAEEVKRRWPGCWDDVPVPSRKAIKTTFDKFMREGTCLKDEVDVWELPEQGITSNR